MLKTFDSDSFRGLTVQRAHVCAEIYRAAKLIHRRRNGFRLLGFKPGADGAVFYGLARGNEFMFTKDELLRRV